jgi:hypothetical protein
VSIATAGEQQYNPNEGYTPQHVYLQAV